MGANSQFFILGLKQQNEELERKNSKRSMCIRNKACIEKCVNHREDCLCLPQKVFENLFVYGETRKEA